MKSASLIFHLRIRRGLRIDCKSILKSIRRENTNKLVFAHINSLRNKFELLVNQVKGNIDVLMISETEIDVSFHLWNFLMVVNLTG